MTGLSRRGALAGATSLLLGALVPRLGATTPPLGSTALFGAYAAPEPWPSLDSHVALERLLDCRLPLMSWFQSWDNDWLHEQAAVAAGQKRDLLIAWEPWHDDRRPVPPYDVLEGRYDDRIRTFLTGAATYPGEVTIRLGHEMNGNWYPWSVGSPTSVMPSTQVYVRLWRHVVRLGRAVSPRVRWMWCVDARDHGPVRAEHYWPGEAYVDLVAIDAYNGYGPWTWPADLLSPMYARLGRLTRKPLWVAELGSREAQVWEATTKAEWFARLFADHSLPQIERVAFFHADKEFDWRLDSTAATLAAVTAGLSAQRLRHL